MNIWLDTAPLLQHLKNQHNGDNLNTCGNDDPCRYECTNEAPPIAFSPSDVPVTLDLLEADTQDLLTHMLICPDTLYTQRLEDTRWLVCNPVHSGMVAVLDEDAYALLLRFRHQQHPLQAILDDFSISPASATKVVALLVKAGFLLDLDHPPAAAPSASQETLAAWLHVTNACNLSCHYCYVSKNSEHMADDTSRRAVDAVIRSALSYHHSGIHLTYAGGEATLRLPQVITLHDYALQQCEQHGLTLSASLLTNGVALPRRFIEQLKERHIRVGLSLDGIAQTHDAQRPLLNGQGSFSLVDRTISRLLAAGLVPSINVTVTQRNLDDLPSLLDYLLQRDLPFGLSYYRDNECSSHHSNLQFSDAHMIAGMRRAFAFIEAHLPRRPLFGLLVDKAQTQHPRHYTCGVGRNYLAIDQRGGIARCQADLSDTITSIEAENPLRVIRAERRGVQAVAVEDKEGCRSCEWRFWCTGGCPMLTYRLTGRSDIRSPNCAIYKALFPEALRLEALRLLTYESPITV